MFSKPILLLFFFVATLSNLRAYECSAWTRDDDKNLVLKKVTLNDLASDNSFSGRYFNIVSSISETPIAFNASLENELQIRACTVYYHLTIARNYFLNQFPENHVRGLKTITIRIEMPYSFIDSSHFMHEDFKTYNNSLTIPASNAAKLDSIAPWNYEIWFAPAKKVKVDNSVEQAAKMLGSSTAQESLRLGVLTSAASNFASQLAQGMTITSFDGKVQIQSLVLSLAIVTVTPWLIEQFSSLVKRSIYLDTALIPEVIYHEFAHIALSRHLKLTHHSPIIEGLANYFAAAVGKMPAILHKTKKLARGLDKLKVNNKVKYESWMEDQKYAQYGFVLALLAEIRREIGDVNADKLIYHAHTKLSATSNITSHLTAALQESARVLFEKDDQKLILMKLTAIWQRRSL